jgi:hypothetical protein
MDILCPTVTYTLSWPQHGIHQVIISCWTRGGDLFRVILKDEHGFLIGDPDRYLQYRMNSILMYASIEVNRPKDLVIPAYAIDPPPLPYHELIATIFKQYVDEHVPKTKHINQIFHVPAPTEQIVKNVMERLEEDMDQAVDRLIQTSRGNELARYPMRGNGEEVVHQLGFLGAYGLEVHALGRNNDHVLFICAVRRPMAEYQDTNIGKAVTRFMDQWEPAQLAEKMAQTNVQ